MNGKLIFGLGLLATVLGGFGLYFAYEAASPGGAAAAWAAIVAGALALLGGAAMFMRSFMAPQRAQESALAHTEIRLLIEAMGAMAAADGQIADQEIETIVRVYQHMLGTRISASDVQGILYGIDTNIDIGTRLAAARSELTPQMRRLIFNCCFSVMMSDLVEDRREEQKIQEIGQALGYNETQIADMIAIAGV